MTTAYKDTSPTTFPGTGNATTTAFTGVISEALTKKILTERTWTDKLRYLDEFEILRAVFKFAGVRALKNCRLANKVWNVEACAALRRDSYVRLYEALEEELEVFRSMLDDIKTKGTPSPFGRLHFSSGQLKSENMDLFLFDNKINIEDFYVHEPPLSYKVDFQKHLYQILMRNAPYLRCFHCALIDNVNFGLINSKTRAKVYLPNLTEFGYWENDVSSKPFSLNFVVEILNGSPNIKNFHPKILNDRTLGQLLKRTNMTKIEDLYVQSLNSSHFPILLKLELAHLKVLSIQINRNREEHNKVSSEMLQRIVGNYRHTIEDLSINWLSNTMDTSFPVCPMLKNLIIDDWNGSLGLFDMETLPSLKSIHKIYHEDFALESVHSPHTNVEYLTIEDRIKHTFQNEIDFLQAVEEKFTYFFEYIRCQYPNLRKLDISIPISNSFITSIIRLFPTLEALTLENAHSCYSLNENIFTGFNKFTLASFLKVNHTLEAFPHPRMPCLLDLKNLKSLVLARYSRDGYPAHMVISNNAIVYGLARMKSLEFLQFNWNSELSVSAVVENLEHIDRIVIVDAFRFQPFKTLQLLKSMMPKIELE
ncbi:unnamed protein product [Allacma fusca]|uniref:F-box domain-containing protein n=1 Tax=Allacma fusca TaxID=39272 RepID=A0A8J2P7A4_9HEXA|nr:unnamed protein product [Allacma fusca]